MPAGAPAGAVSRFGFVGRNVSIDGTTETEAFTGVWKAFPEVLIAAIPASKTAVASAQRRADRGNLFTYHTCK